MKAMAGGWGLVLVLTAATTASAGSLLKWPATDAGLKTGNVVFVHPDGTSVAHWGAARIRWVGPDGMLNWDRLEHLAVYRSHMLDRLGATSHGGGTIHAYGVKGPVDSYGMFGQEAPRSLSGQPFSVMTEALRAGKAVGIINSGHLNEPGTGCYLASVHSRGESEEIVRQIMASGAQVIMAGGEDWLLPTGVRGRHRVEGKRKDGRNLIAEAKAQGYVVVFNRAELLAITGIPERVLGVFASGHTFNDNTEEWLQVAKLPLYGEDAPTLAEMTGVALRVLERSPNGFFLVVEEEGTDNFSNKANSSGMLESLRRADEALGIVRTYRQSHPDTLLMIAADSDASGPQLVAVDSPEYPLPAATDFGAQLDGAAGTASRPFVSAPDENGRVFPFGIVWSTGDDTSGGILLRAEGPNATLLDSGCADNTDVYRLIYATLFGKRL
jgi:alkaline phosphatase